jgi:hypothetical protein
LGDADQNPGIRTSIHVSSAAISNNFIPPPTKITSIKSREINEYAKNPLFRAKTQKHKRSREREQMEEDVQIAEIMARKRRKYFCAAVDATQSSSASIIIDSDSSALSHNTLGTNSASNVMNDNNGNCNNIKYRNHAVNHWFAVLILNSDYETRPILEKTQSPIDMIRCWNASHGNMKFGACVSSVPGAVSSTMVNKNLSTTSFKSTPAPLHSDENASGTKTKKSIHPAVGKEENAASLGVTASSVGAKQIYASAQPLLSCAEMSQFSFKIDDFNEIKPHAKTKQAVSSCGLESTHFGAVMGPGSNTNFRSVATTMSVAPVMMIKNFDAQAAEWNNGKFRLGQIIGPFASEEQVDKYLRLWTHGTRGTLSKAAKGEALAHYLSYRSYGDFNVLFFDNNLEEYVDLYYNSPESFVC